MTTTFKHLKNFEATTAVLSDSTDKRFLTDAQEAKLDTLDAETRIRITQPRATLVAGNDPVIVDTAVIMGSHASAASVASVASGASSGSIASQSSFSSRATFASLASAGSLSSASSYGSIAAIVSAAAVASLASRSSQGSAATTSAVAFPAVAAAVSIAGPVVLEFPDVATANEINIVKQGATGTVVYTPRASATFNGIARRDNSTQHQVDFAVPDGVNWTVSS